MEKWLEESNGARVTTALAEGRKKLSNVLNNQSQELKA
jgi:hypothetical protein